MTFHTLVPGVPKKRYMKYNFFFNSSLAAPGELVHSLLRRTTCKIQNDCKGAPKWLAGSGKVYTPRFLGAPINFRLNKFFDPNTPSMREIDNGEKRKGKVKRENNVVYSSH